MKIKEILRVLKDSRSAPIDDIITCEKVIGIIEIDKKSIKDYWRDEIVIIRTNNQRNYIMYRKEAEKFLGFQSDKEWKPQWALLRLSCFEYGIWAWYRGEPNWN